MLAALYRAGLSDCDRHSQVAPRGGGCEGRGEGRGEGEVTLYERRGSRFWRSAGEALAFGEQSAKGLHRFTMLHVTRRIRNCSPFFSAY